MRSADTVLDAGLLHDRQEGDYVEFVQFEEDHVKASIEQCKALVAAPRGIFDADSAG